jgi:hypothetical protein
VANANRRPPIRARAAGAGPQRGRHNTPIDVAPGRSPGPGSEAGPGRPLLYFGGPGWTGLLQDERRRAGRVGEMWDGRTLG